VEKHIEKIVVVKVGGSLLKSGFPRNILQDLKVFHEKFGVILVHGGAALVTEMAEKLGKQQKFIVSPDGMRSRYTDLETMQIYTMVMAGRINKELVTLFHANGINALGLSGADGMLLRAQRKKKLIILDERGRRVAIDGGYTGKIVEVNGEFLSSLIKMGYLPIIAPIAISEEYELLNVDSDRAAAYIAGAIKADHLIFCTDVEGVVLDGKLVEKFSLIEAEEEIGKIGHGMRKKVYAAVEALNMGVKETLIISGLKDAALTLALEHKVGTLIAPY
jgi:acetylglutamate/LysW-gamma-L-alpha-aminoadipate kinase